jgi:hypothetical protein
MSCYFRHLKDIFAEVGIEVTAGNKKQIDRAVHQVMGTDYKDCPNTWQKLKQQVLADDQKRRDFIAKLREAVK